MNTRKVRHVKYVPDSMTLLHFDVKRKWVSTIKLTKCVYEAILLLRNNKWLILGCSPPFWDNWRPEEAGRSIVCHRVAIVNKVYWEIYCSNSLFSFYHVLFFNFTNQHKSSGGEWLIVILTVYWAIVVRCSDNFVGV